MAHTEIKWEYVREKDGVRCYVNLEDLCWCMGIGKTRPMIRVRRRINPGAEASCSGIGLELPLMGAWVG